MQQSRLTDIAHEIWLHVVRPRDTVVDATCGNGHDAAFLAAVVGPEAEGGTVYGFDVQASACSSTRSTVHAAVPSESLPALHLIHGCHSKMQEHVGSNTASLVCFNFGYLPGGDKNVTTTQATSLAAVEAALEVLMPGGLLSMLCYTGHPGGVDEFEAVRKMVSELEPRYWVSSEMRLLNRPTAPVLLLVWKRQLSGKF